MGATFRCVILVAIFQHCVCPPVTKKQPVENVNSSENEVDNLRQFGIEYDRYLKQVIETLESDPDFKRKLENSQDADIRSGKIAEQLDYVSHHVRTKLDELKRQELDRLRSLAKMAMERENNHQSPHLQPPGHLDHANPNSFEIADLRKLIRKVTEDLEEADKKGHDEFKEYKMQQEFEQHEKMKAMDDEQKAVYKEDLERMKKKHNKHEPLHHPGSKKQLEEVWEKQDHMAQQAFDPKTFFYLHDLDGNGFWDQDEVKTLFLKELDKLYEAGVPEDDMRERAEEMERMREHVFKETDTNRDRLISFDEFFLKTKAPDFEKDEGWETIDQQQVYTPDEYAEFERRRQEEIQRLIKAGRIPPHPPGMMMPPHPGMPQGQYMQPQHPNSVYQQQQQQQQFAQQQQFVQQQQQQQQYAQQQYAQQQAQMGQGQQQQPVPGNYQNPQAQAPQQPINQGSQQQPMQFQQPQAVPQQQVPQPIQGQVPQQQVAQPLQGQVPQQQVPQSFQGQVPQQLGQPGPAGQQVPSQPVLQQPLNNQDSQQPIRQIPQQPVVQEPIVQSAQVNVQNNNIPQQHDPNSIQIPRNPKNQAPNDNAPPVRIVPGSIPKQPYPRN